MSSCISMFWRGTLYFRSYKFVVKYHCYAWNGIQLGWVSAISWSLTWSLTKGTRFPIRSFKIDRYIQGLKTQRLSMVVHVNSARTLLASWVDEVGSRKVFDSLTFPLSNLNHCHHDHFPFFPCFNRIMYYMTWYCFLYYWTHRINMAPICFSVSLFTKHSGGFRNYEMRSA